MYTLNILGDKGVKKKKPATKSMGMKRCACLCNSCSGIFYLTNKTIKCSKNKYAGYSINKSYVRSERFLTKLIIPSNTVLKLDRTALLLIIGDANYLLILYLALAAIILFSWRVFDQT